MSRVFVLRNRFNHSIHFVRTPCINVHVYAIPDRGEPPGKDILRRVYNKARTLAHRDEKR